MPYAGQGRYEASKPCSSLKEAAKLFGGDKRLAAGLLAGINAIEQADALKDIIVMPAFRFHNLRGKLNGYFAVDDKTIRDKWRIILQPPDDEEKASDPCSIDKIAAVVRIVEIREVSAHYE